MEKTKAQYREQLELLSTQELQSILMLSLQPENNISEAMIEAALDILDLRDDQPAPVTDPQQALDTLRRSFNTEDGLGQALYPATAAPQHHSVKKGFWWGFIRSAAAIAASVALVFGSLLAAQASGIDALGALAKWSEEIFQFVSNDDEYPAEAPAGIPDRVMYDALEGGSIPGLFAPGYIPAGYTLTNISSEQSDMVSLLCAVYKNDSGDPISITFEKWNNSDNIPEMMYEKGTQNVEIFISNGRVFYLFCNTDRWRGAWSDSQYVININGLSSKSELIRIIESIQEVNYD